MANFVWTVNLLDQNSKEVEAEIERNCIGEGEIEHEDNYIIEPIGSENLNYMPQVIAECYTISGMIKQKNNDNVQFNFNEIVEFNHLFYTALDVINGIEDEYQKVTSIETSKDELIFAEQVNHVSSAIHSIRNGEQLPIYVIEDYKKQAKQIEQHNLRNVIMGAWEILDENESINKKSKLINNLLSSSIPSCYRARKAWSMMIRLDTITVPVKGVFPYRRYLNTYEERNIGRIYFCYNMKLLRDYANQIYNLICSIFSKWQYHIGKNISMKIYNMVGIKDFGEFINDFLNSLKKVHEEYEKKEIKGNPLNPYIKNIKGKNCVACIELNNNNDKMYYYAFSNFYDCNDKEIVSRFEWNHAFKMVAFSDVGDMFKGLIGSTSKIELATTNKEMRRYFFYDKSKGKYIKLSVSQTINELMATQFGSLKENQSDFTCCERKILAHYEKSPVKVTKVNVFAQKAVCFKCVPAFLEIFTNAVPVKMYYQEFGTDGAIIPIKQSLEDYWNMVKNDPKIEACI